MTQHLFNQQTIFKHFTCSRGLPAFLHRERLSLVVTSYQSGRIYAICSDSGTELTVSFRNFSHATGLDHRPGWLAVATDAQIMYLREDRPEPQHARFVLQRSDVIGSVAPHQLFLRSNASISFVATMYNCIAQVAFDANFQPIWKPSFIDAIKYEDRCHLNGMAARGDSPAFATAFSATNERSGWRDNAVGRGIVIDIAQNRIVADGLTMPHSPTLADGMLWIANSGTGEIGTVDCGSGDFTPRLFVPGYLRGLKLRNGLCFAAASKFRHERMAGDLSRILREHDTEARCGLFIGDPAKGKILEWFEFGGSVSEIFDVALLENTTRVEFLGPRSKGFDDAAKVAPFA